jgi:hypothetical protein
MLFMSRRLLPLGMMVAIIELAMAKGPERGVSDSMCLLFF